RGRVERDVIEIAAELEFVPCSGDRHVVEPLQTLFGPHRRQKEIAIELGDAVDVDFGPVGILRLRSEVAPRKLEPGLINEARIENVRVAEKHCAVLNLILRAARRALQTAEPA